MIATKERMYVFGWLVWNEENYKQYVVKCLLSVACTYIGRHNTVYVSIYIVAIFIAYMYDEST